MVVLTFESFAQRVEEACEEVDLGRLRKAYEFSRKAHGNQMRRSGDLAFHHALETAQLLLPLKPDEDTVVASLLHDVPYDTAISLKQLEKNFGRGVADLIHANEKLSLIKVQDGHADVESWRRMFLAMAKDLRVIFIRLAERLHNMRTLEYLSQESQRRIASETLSVYAPIASRLGLYLFKSELEDLCFKFLFPKEYADLYAQVSRYEKKHLRFMTESKHALEALLKTEGIQGEVSGRIKHLYSIYRKMRKKNVSDLEDVFDFFALRVVLDDQTKDGDPFYGHCYGVIGAIHSQCTPMPGRFKDYVAVPKLNGYRSLHTTVFGLAGGGHRRPVEVQVRTRSMHKESELGIASHWFYEDSRRASAGVSRDELQQLLKERRLLAKFHRLLSQSPSERGKLEKWIGDPDSLNGDEHDRVVQYFFDHGFESSDLDCLRAAMGGPSEGQSDRSRFFKHQLDWLYGLEELYEDLNPEASHTDLNLFKDRIFVLTPLGDVKDLPAGATPVDFAYAIHSDVGHRCAQAKVNGRIVKLDHPLSNGDVVEIVTKKESNPSRYWFSFVVSSAAKEHIGAWFRKNDRDKNIKIGRELLSGELKRLRKPGLGQNYQLLSNYGGKSLSVGDREHIVEMVGNGTMTPQSVIKTLFSEEELLGKPTSREKPKASLKASKNSPSKGLDEVLVTGQRDLPIVLSRCCKPGAPHLILGHVTRGKAIRIHRSTCHHLKEVDPERLLEAKWANQNFEPVYRLSIRLRARKRKRLLSEVTSTIEGLSMQLLDVKIEPLSAHEIEIFVSCEISNYAMLAELLRRFQRIAGVAQVQKVS